MIPATALFFFFLTVGQSSDGIAEIITRVIFYGLDFLKNLVFLAPISVLHFHDLGAYNGVFWLEDLAPPRQ